MPIGLGVSLGVGGGKPATSGGAPAAAGGALVNTYSVLNDGVDDYAGGAYAHSDFAATNAFTLSLWFKMPDVTPSGNSALVYWGNSTSSANSMSSYFLTDGRLFTQWKLGGTVYVPAARFSDNTWYHYCLTRNAGSWNSGDPTAGQYSKVYINTAGESFVGAYDVVSNTSGINLGHASNHMRFGLYFGANFPWNGYVDEASVWTVEKDATEVEALFNDGVPTDLTDSSNLKSWWRMGDSDSGTGTTVTDVQEVSNLSLVNGAAFAEVVPS